MKRLGFLKFGIACYLLFLATYAAMACFVGNLFLPRTIDHAAQATAGPTALLINLGLVLLFGLQHSVMARPGFKKAWTRYIPAPIERSTYVLFSCLACMVLLWQWRPIPIVVWDVSAPAARAVLWSLFALGWLSVPVVSLMIHHFDLFGVRQVWLYYRGREYSALPFRTPYLYRYVRHPLYLAWALAFWATPTMTLGHLLFSASLTVYMVLAARVEERDLVQYFGRHYREYQNAVPMFLPLRTRRPRQPELATANSSPQA